MTSKIILISYLCTGYIIGGATLKRSRALNPPCFYDERLEGSRTDLTKHLHEIRRSLRELKAGAEIFRNAMANYCVNEGDVQDKYFIDVVKTDVQCERQKFKRYFHVNRSSFLNEMESHYSSLNLLAYYLEKLHGTASMRARETTQENLRKFQDTVYGCMCSQKMALLSQGQAPLEKVPGGKLSGSFIQLHTDIVTRCDQEKLEYIVAIDGQRLINYLTKLYSSFRKTSPCTCE